jgi:hypothetical protein
MRSYFIFICVFTLIILSMAMGFNWLINPYDIWPSPKIEWLNSSKSELFNHERIFKTVGPINKSASIAILGTSRSDNGLNPAHPALMGKGVNLAIGAQSYKESRMLFDKLLKKNIQQVVIGLDFFAANATYATSPDFVLENFADDRSWKLGLSGTTFIDSLLTIKNRNAPFSPPWTKEGLSLSYSKVEKVDGNKKMMQSSENGYLTQIYLPPPLCSFEFVSQTDKYQPTEEIRAIFARAHRDHITLKLLISPSHARQWETLAAAGLWNKWEEWKHRLVKMNEEEAQRAGEPAFPLWDFSGYHSISTETVPALGDTTTMMHWYFDSSHYTPAAGDLVLDRIFNFHSPDRTVPDDFGDLLTSQNIEAHLAHIRTDREHYRLTHPEDIAEIEAMAREVAKTKHCQTVFK